VQFSLKASVAIEGKFDKWDATVTYPSTDATSWVLDIVLVFWLTALFIGFGLFAPRNGTVVASLLVSSLSVSGAIFLILEMYAPYAGLIQLSSAPLRAALSQLGK